MQGSHVSGSICVASSLRTLGLGSIKTKSLHLGGDRNAPAIGALSSVYRSKEGTRPVHDNRDSSELGVYPWPGSCLFSNA